MLFFVPPWMYPTVTTPNSLGRNSRETIDCKLSIVFAAIRIGSIAAFWSGRDGSGYLARSSPPQTPISATIRHSNMSQPRLAFRLSTYSSILEAGFSVTCGNRIPGTASSWSKVMAATLMNYLPRPVPVFSIPRCPVTSS